MGRRAIMKGNVVLPSDLSRQRYVDYCLRTQTASVLCENGDFLKNCPIVHNFCGVNEGLLNSLVFPETSTELGSRVVVLYLEENEMGIIIGCLRDGNYIKLEEEYQFKAIRQNKGNSFTINGSGLRGVLDLIAIGENSGGGKIRMKAFTKEQEGELEFSTNNFFIQATERISITSNKYLDIIIRDLNVKEKFTKINYEFGVGFNYEDEFGNTIKIYSDGIDINGDKINVGKNSLEPAVKGDKLVSILEELLNAILVMTVGTGVGPSTLPINLASFTAIIPKLQTIKSQKVNLE